MQKGTCCRHCFRETLRTRRDVRSEAQTDVQWYSLFGNGSSELTLRKPSSLHCLLPASLCPAHMLMLCPRRAESASISFMLLVGAIRNESFKGHKEQLEPRCWLDAGDHDVLESNQREGSKGKSCTSGSGVSFEETSPSPALLDRGDSQFVECEWKTVNSEACSSTWSEAKKHLLQDGALRTGLRSYFSLVVLRVSIEWADFCPMKGAIHGARGQHGPCGNGRGRATEDWQSGDTRTDSSYLGKCDRQGWCWKTERKLQSKEQKGGAFLACGCGSRSQQDHPEDGSSMELHVQPTHALPPWERCHAGVG